MTTTPNFLWLEAILRHARAYLSARPDGAASKRYLSSVEEALEVFRRTRRETDQSYLGWRHAYNDVIKAHKMVRLAYDQARKHCIEWGFDDYPDHFVSYTEEEKTQAAALDMIAFLEKHDPEEADWIEPTLGQLRRTIDDARQAFARQEVEWGQYRGRVRARRIGYDRGYSLSQELFDVLKDELDRNSEDYRKLSPYAT